MSELSQDQLKKMHFSSKQISAANHTSVAEYCKIRGIEFDEKGRGIEHDSLVLRPGNRFYWNKINDGGTGALSFVEKVEMNPMYDARYENMDPKLKFKEGVLRVLQSGASVLSDAQIKQLEQQSHQPFRFNQNEVAPNMNQAYDYMEHVRGIGSDTIDELAKQNVMRQDKYGNILFLWREPGDTSNNPNKIHGVGRQGTKIDYKRFGKRGTLKKIEKNSEAGYAFNFETPDIAGTKNPPKQLRFFEAPIDAISFYELSKLKGRPLTNTRLIAMDGLKDEVVKSFVQQWGNELSKANVKPVQPAVGLCVDNDEAGKHFIHKMQGMWSNLADMSPNPKYGKDWNDVLKDARGLQKSTVQKPTDIQASSDGQKQASQAALSKTAVTSYKTVENVSNVQNKADKQALNKAVNDIKNKSEQIAKKKTFKKQSYYDRSQLPDLQKRMAQFNLQQAEVMKKYYDAQKSIGNKNMIVATYPREITNGEHKGQYVVHSVHYGELENTYRQQIVDKLGSNADQDYVTKNINGMINAANDVTIKTKGKTIGPLVIYNLNKTMAKQAKEEQAKKHIDSQTQSRIDHNEPHGPDNGQDKPDQPGSDSSTIGNE